LRDLQANEPWHIDRIQCPLLFAYGTRGAEHHVEGMQYLHSLAPASTLVVIEGARHDAPNSHSLAFAHAVVERLAEMAGSPWADVVGDNSRT